ncbi:MAG TPA: cation diffusion facilitator family transporter [Clostridiaceae bacterium]|nr:cation diffusion facilitator family transporter [Clostridiaceae bacterium]
MINYLIHKLTDGRNYKENLERERIGVIAGSFGVFLNFVLFFVKVLLGLATGSIALTADAFNNLTDTASSVITIFGFKLANRPPDEDHPYGHGRFEYLTGLTISVLVMFVGFQFIVSSYKRIVQPEPVVFEWITLFILVLSIMLKLIMHLMYKRLGKMTGSNTLIATGTDALGDVFTTSVVVLGLVISRFTTLPIDGFIGIIIALYIIYNGVTLTLDTIGPIIGEKPDLELVEKIKEKVTSYDKIYGVHDLELHSYGPGKTMATIHAEVPYDIDLVEIHNIVDKIERKVKEELGINLVIHMDPINEEDDEYLHIKQEVTEIALRIPKVMSIHDFRYTGLSTHKIIIFEAVVDSKNTTAKEREDIEGILRSTLELKYPDTKIYLTIDLDVSML